MKQEELDNLIEEEFNEIKDKCKSRAKVVFYVSLTLIVIFIPLLAACIHYKGITNLKHTQIVALILIFLSVCDAGWLLLNNYRFLKRANSLDTPDKLLDSYEKKILDGRKAYVFFWLAFMCFNIDAFIYWFHDEGAFTLVTILTLLIALIAYFIYKYLQDKSYYVQPKDVAIIERLKELIEKK